IAGQLGVPFNGFWLDAGAETLQSRIASRPKGQSDATLDVLEMQLARDLGPMDWQRIDATAPIDHVLAAVEALLDQPA
ncbi:MAG: aminoglycoside phosphotransferase, partial [Rhizobium sp.]|nr:aminoglycoside phosphotransferase [Rhizobium sp.]